MSKCIVLDPFSGISGDMMLGALVDLGAPFKDIQNVVQQVPELSKVIVSAETVRRGAFAATRVRVECPHEHAHRGLSDIAHIIERADLPAGVKTAAIDTFTRLARAEAKVHGADIETIHFHEVGALDAIVDIVGSHVALHSLGNPTGYVRTLALGKGSTRSAHGEIPLPAPATVELLAGYPVQFTDRSEELVTPTGAALVSSRFTPIDADTVFTPEKIGHGAGSRESDGMPNVLRAMLGSVAPRPAHVCVITSTIDDMNPELYGHLLGRLFEAGALDVYYNAIMMKKNRPGVEVTIIANERLVYQVVDRLMSETTTLGVRVNREQRVELAREKSAIETEYGTIAIKIAHRPDGSVTMSPEYESCREAAEKGGIPLRRVYEAAQLRWSAKND